MVELFWGRVPWRSAPLDRARSRLRLTMIFRDLALAHDEIIEAISWMCGVTAEWTLRQSRAPQSKR